jgi:beta-fructofuranosidase
MPSRVFFRPAEGWVGDVMPVEADGELRLYYLLERRHSPKPGTPWALTRTRDLVTFSDDGVALPHGTETDADFNAYTGSIVTDDHGVQHLFYTAQNPDRLGADGLPLQLVAHATTANPTDGWVKHPEHAFGAPEGYETADFRDPFVFRDDAGLWRMLVAARHDTGPLRRRGLIAQLVSTDLVHWDPVAPLWDPRRYVMHECPEVFRLGQWWYLVYSEFSDAFVTRYRMARSVDGPWLAPERDTVDGRAFYAAKSAAVNGRRIFAGWIATREGEVDDGAWQWAGTMSLLEAHQNADGSLGFALPEELVASFTEEVAFDLEPGGLASPDGYGCVVSDVSLPAQCYLRAELEIDPGTVETGLLVRTSADGDHGYVLRLEPKRGRMVLDRWPRASIGAAQWQISGDVPHFVELERPADLTGPTHTLEIVLEDDIAVFVLDRQVCLSTRLYDHTHDRLGIFVGDGTAKLRDLTLRRRPDSVGRHDVKTLEGEK